MKTECPVCRNPLSFETTTFGKIGRCQACGARLRIQKDGQVTLESKQDSKPRSALTTAKQGEPTREKSSRTMPRWGDWLAASAVALALGVVLGMLLTTSGHKQREAELQSQLDNAQYREERAKATASSIQHKADDLARQIKIAREQTIAAKKDPARNAHWKVIAAELRRENRRKVLLAQKKAADLQVELSRAQKKATGLQVELSRAQRQAQVVKADLARLRSKVNAARKRVEAEQAAKRNAPWKDKSNWRRLRLGMSMDEVRQIFGAPGRVNTWKILDSVFVRWYYPEVLGGNVLFENARVVSWSEP